MPLEKKKGVDLTGAQSFSDTKYFSCIHNFLDISTKAKGNNKRNFLQEKRKTWSSGVSVGIRLFCFGYIQFSSFSVGASV